MLPNQPTNQTTECVDKLNAKLNSLGSYVVVHLQKDVTASTAFAIMRILAFQKQAMLTKLVNRHAEGACLNVLEVNYSSLSCHNDVSVLNYRLENLLA